MGSPCKPKSLPSKLYPSVRYHLNQKIESPRPSPDHKRHIGEKGISNFTKNFACIFITYTIITYLKKLDGTKSLNTKQCPVGLSPTIIPQVSPFLPKVSPPLMLLCCTHRVWTGPLPLNLHGKPLGRGNPYPTSKNVLIFPTRKIPLNRFTSSVV